MLVMACFIAGGIWGVPQVRLEVKMHEWRRAIKPRNSKYIGKF